MARTPYAPSRHRRDANEARIRAYLRQLGIWHIQMPREAGFDLLICWRGELLPVEIKNPDARPSDRQLTPNESSMQQILTNRGVRYLVWLTEADMQRDLQLPGMEG